MKKRLDILVQEQLEGKSRQQIQSWIMQGKVQVDGRLVCKPGTPTSLDAQITCDIQEPKYVSRAGFKLEGALDHFKLDVTGLVMLDAGLSTGGFTDCLLQRGAKRIYGIDVGYGQVHEKIRADERVVVMERTNLRNLESLPELVDAVTLDLSFISIVKVLPAVINLMKPEAQLIVLIKPQFEAARHEIGRGGIVRDVAAREAIVQRVCAGIVAQGFTQKDLTLSSLPGATGNQEYCGLFVHENSVSNE